jgi:HTH-like domain
MKKQKLVWANGVEAFESYALRSGSIGLGITSDKNYAPNGSGKKAELKKAVEELLLEFAGYGYRRVTKALQRAGWQINHKKVLRLLRKWGLLCRPFRKKN